MKYTCNNNAICVKATNSRPVAIMTTYEHENNRNKTIFIYIGKVMTKMWRR